MSVVEQVTEFHEVYGCPIRTQPDANVPEAEMRYELIREEFAELRVAIDERDIIEIADALGDLLYVIYGAALTFGIDLDAVVSEIHRSNLSKLASDGSVLKREDGKILKGPRFFRPDLATVLGVTK